MFERQKEPGAPDLASGPQTWLTVIKDTLDMGTCQNLRVCKWDYHSETIRKSTNLRCFEAFCIGEVLAEFDARVVWLQDRLMTHSCDL